MQGGMPGKKIRTKMYITDIKQKSQIMTNDDQVTVMTLIFEK